jgi:hypothetical protein
MLELLGQLGADLKAVDNHGHSVIALATQKHEVACVELLKKWGVEDGDDKEKHKQHKAKAMPGWD